MNIAIYCGSAFGNDYNYENSAKELAQELFKRDMNVVYGGSTQGLMGVISNESMRLGTKVTGVIPYSLINKEILSEEITEIHKVHTMSERKIKMEELSDAFISMPGGYGTFDEMFEVISLGQLGHHSKPCAFYNINGYYDKLMEFLYHSSESGFIDKRFVDMIIVSDNPVELLDKIQNYTPVKNKWEE
ncbi:MAG: TIGR00730 family Rossman fold protein [Arcobacteraceae bacterium]